MRVVEIFTSIEGEGKRAGKLCTFIRLAGCNLRCSYCDTKYAQQHDDGHSMSVPEILKEVDRISIGRLVTLTGGEPLIHENVDELIQELMLAGYHVNVETNGTVAPRLLSQGDKLFYTMDYKCYSSGQSEMMSMNNIDMLTDNDVLKFVVGDQADMFLAAKVMSELTNSPKIYLSPVFGKIDPKQIVDFMKTYNLFDCTVQVQLHKVIWDPEERGV